MLPSLRRRGVVKSWKEHTPGSIIVKLAPMSSLLLASKRRRDGSDAMPKEQDPKSLSALDSTTLRLLRRLAIQNLELLGVTDSKPFVEQEMVRTFSALAASIGVGEGREERLRAAIRRAIDEISD
jgi:hypothetical protein